MANVEVNVSNKIVDSQGNYHNSIRQLAKTLHVKRERISKALNENGVFVHNGVSYLLYNKFVNNSGLATSERPVAMEKEVITVQVPREDEDEYQDYLKYKRGSEVPFEKFTFKLKTSHKGSTYAVALASDWHVEECFTSESTMGVNEYNPDIAKERVEKYFANLVSCINADGIDDLILALIGDFSSNYLHPELERTNAMSPIESQMFAQSLIYSGIKFICENTKLHSIKVIGLCGNHGRICVKPSHNDFASMNMEYVMYKNIERECELTNLPVEFYIPKSEIALVDMPDGNKFLFTHGQSIRGGNGIAGILPALMRACLKWGHTFHQTKTYCGHFHQLMSTPTVSVNGSLMGYNPLSIAGQYISEEPQQLYEVWSENLGHIVTRNIYTK
jgi:hypothetical protein